jgi:hypothetical protein
MIDALRGLRPLLGSLVVVPLVALCFGSQWTSDERLEASLRLAPDGRASDEIPARAHARALLPKRVDLVSLELRGDPAVGYRVFAPRADGSLAEIWTALEGDVSSGRALRRSPPLRLPEPTEGFSIAARMQRFAAPMPALAVIVPRVSFPHVALIPLLWAIYLALRRASRTASAGPGACRALAFWGRGDLWLTAVLVYAMLFRLAAPGRAGVAAALAIVGGVAIARRAPAATAALVATAALFSVLAPRALTAVVIAQVSEQFDLTVDHRPKPNGDNINSDGLRFDGEADSVWDDDFAVLFLGDSFTFGTRLRDSDTYPQAFENAATQRGCRERVRAINFGWPSASPLLSLRLLRRIGHAYRADLVVYSLDVTDFHDDLRYERALRSAGEFEVDTTRVVQQLADRFAPWASAGLGDRSGLPALRRPGRPRPVGGEPELPTDRFFVTSAPLDETRPWIEAGVMKNLEAIRRFSAETLGSPTAVVLYPRAYQYSTSEAPESWERRAYDARGPFVREPFRYFEEVADDLRYPVIDLMSTFERSSEQPLFLVDDPHWNRRGARLAGEAVFDALVERGLLPCDAS